MQTVVMVLGRSGMSERAGGVGAARARSLRRLGTRVAAALALALATPATAAPPPGAGPKCTLDATFSMVFTGYTPFGPGVPATATLTYSCPGSVQDAWIGLSTPRAMTAGGDSLAFDLHQSPYPGPVWTDQPPVAVSAASRSTTVFGFLPPSQNVAAGNYLATLTVSIYTGNNQNLTDTASLTVAGNFAPTCTIATGMLSFGSYDPGATRDAEGSIEIACTKDASYTVGLGLGSNPSGTTRQMANGGERLRYEVYTDGTRSTAWSTTSTVGGVAPSTDPVVVPVYGRIPAGQAVKAGPYGDSVQSIINF